MLVGGNNSQIYVEANNNLIGVALRYSHFESRRLDRQVEEEVEEKRKKEDCLAAPSPYLLRLVLLFSINLFYDSIATTFV